MLKRDFTKSNKEYLKKNKNILITFALFLLVGILMFAILGMNGNFEIKGYNEFSVNITEKIAKDYNEHKDEIGKIINSYDGKFDSVLIYDEGDNTQYVIRYMNDVENDVELEINKLVAEELGVEIENVSQHIEVGGVVQTKDYVYTVASILILILIASIFAYVRYNGASSLAILLSCLLGTLTFMSLGTIFRLSVGMSYFAMLVILNLLIVYLAISLFENMHKSSWLVSGDYETAIKTGMKSSSFRTTLISVSLMAIGLLFILFAPLALKLVSLNIMFMAVALLATALYIIPFMWSLFITKCRKREYKVKVETTKET